jgi:uncharacterized protein involved in exopolysaccharide biosynthesis
MATIDLRFYIYVFLQRLHYFLLAAATVTAAGCLVALYLPPSYVAVARILVESPRVSTDLARASAPTDAIEQLQVTEQLLTTRDSLLALARRLAVYDDMDSIPDTEIVNDMRARTRVEPVLSEALGGSTPALSFAISFEAEDPALAAEVANEYARMILRDNAQKRRERAADALKFFQQEVDRLGAALRAARDAVVTFKGRNRGALPESLEFRQMQKSNFESALRQLEREESSLRIRLATLQHMAASQTGGTDGRTATSDAQLLAELRRALAEQQGMFSESSPNLRALRKRIADLEQSIARRPSAGAAGEASPRNALPPELQVQLADIEGQSAYIAEEKKELAESIASMANSIAATTKNAAILEALDRSYQNAQAQYNEATAKLAQASTGERIEAEAIGEKLTLLESATPPLHPVKPKRRLIAAASAAAGLGLGLALIVLLELLAPTIRRPVELAAVFEGEPFATLPYIVTGRELLRRRLAIAAIVLVVVGAIPGLKLAQTYFPERMGPILSVVPEQLRTALSLPGRV